MYIMYIMYSNMPFHITWKGFHGGELVCFNYSDIWKTTEKLKQYVTQYIPLVQQVEVFKEMYMTCWTNQEYKTFVQ